MSSRGRPQKRKLAILTTLASFVALLVPLSAQQAQATHGFFNQNINLEVVPERSTNTTGVNHRLFAVLMAGDTGNATVNADPGGGGQPVEVDFEIESGPQVTITESAGAGGTQQAPPFRQSDTDNSPATPDMTCVIPVGRSECTVGFSSASAGTNIIRAWVDDDRDNTTHPGTAPADGDPTEGRNAGPSDCVQPETPGTPPEPATHKPADPPGDCPTFGAQQGARSERDDTDVVEKTWVQAIANVCVDAEPDSAGAGVTNPDTLVTNASNTSHTIRARVTDGSRVGDPDAAPAFQDPQGNRFDCSGQAIPGQSVRITVTDDNPDVFIESVNGQSTGGPTFGGPQTATGTADANGFVTFTVRLVDPNNIGDGHNTFLIDVPGSPGGADDSEQVGKDWAAAGAVAVDATPETATNEVNTSHSVTGFTRQAVSPNAPQFPRELDFIVESGPHADNDLDANPATVLGYFGECQTAGPGGSCTRSYTGTEIGTDVIRVFHDANGNDQFDFGEASDLVNKDWVLAGQALARVRLDAEPTGDGGGATCNGDRVPPIDEASWEQTATPNAPNSIHKLCGELFRQNDQPLAGGMQMTITGGPGFFTPCTGAGAGSANLGTSVFAEEAASGYAEACINSTQGGTTLVTGSSQGRTDTAAKPWTGADARNIRCTIDAPQHQAGRESAIVRCQATDRFNNPVPGEAITWAEDGPGRFETTPQATTGNDGFAEARLTATPDERGVQTVTATLTDDLTGPEPGDVDECDRPANDPNTGLGAGNCSSSVSHTWVPQTTPPVTSPPPPVERDHPRVITINADRHVDIGKRNPALLIKGDLDTPDGFDECHQQAPIKVQIRAGGEWITRKTDDTNNRGIWKVLIRDVVARYRAVAVPFTITDPVANTIDNCLRDTDRIRHGHGGRGR